MMDYPQEHLDALTSRLLEYERVLKLKQFKRLKTCHICETVDYRCHDCMLNGNESGGGCYNDDGRTGFDCNTQRDQRTQFNHLLKRLDDAGYEFK